MNFVEKFDGFSPSLDAHARGHVHVDSVSTHAPPDAIIVNDAQLLFTGDLKRSGLDLVLSKDDHELVLQDYFKGEKRAALASPDGAHLTGDIVNALTGYTQYAQAGAVEPPKVIGHVSKLTGSATAVRNGVAIVLNQGDNVLKGDVVQAGADSTLGLTFIDGTVFGLGPNAKMVLNEMVYDPNGSNNSSLMSLVQGTISFVAGATAKHGDMKVDTPVATMGIRGTAVLVEIDFTVPAQGGAPPASFQVLVEPDGTTGSYILFDKTTLNPIATVDQAGTQTVVNGQGTVSFLTTAPLSADAQKIIADVFALKFTDNSNPNTKLASNFTDSIVPTSTTFNLLVGDTIVPTTIVLANFGSTPGAAPVNGQGHVALAPTVVVTQGTSFNEQLNLSHSQSLDSVSGIIKWADINLGDHPTASASFTSFTYLNAGNVDVTSSLTAAQLAAIKAVEVPLQVEQAPNNLNIGSATWTYSLPDGAFDFLAAGETLTLTYTVAVDNNFAQSRQVGFQTFTITVTGTNDLPVITSPTQAAAITEIPGVTGSVTPDTAHGVVAFTDPDLTDTHTVNVVALTETGVTTGLADEATVLSWLSLGALTDSTDGVTGSRSWTFSAADDNFDYLAAGETLTLTYLVQVDDHHGGMVTQPITITITGTNDTPVITSPTQAAAITEIPAVTGSTTPDTASGVVTFTDVDLSDSHSVVVWAVSESGVTDGLPDEATVLSWLSLGALTDSTNGVTGSRAWTFSAADKAFDYLAAGETLTLIYFIQVDDHHGGVVAQPVTITITGTNDVPVITSPTQVASITEIPGLTGSTTPDTAHGTVTFTDVDLSDTHSVTITGVTESGVTDGLPNQATILSWLSLGALTDSTNGVTGSRSWTFSAADKDFDYLAAGETLTLTYTIQVDDHHGGVVDQLVTIGITGTNDVPVITSPTQADAITEVPGVTGSTTPDTAHGTVTFTDVDLSDSHNVTISGVTESGVTSGLDLDAVQSWLTLGKLTDSTGGIAGSDAWTFSAPDNSFDYLAAGETLTLTYMIEVDDHHGGVVTQPVTITITGTDDAPVITSPTQAAAITEIADVTGSTTPDTAHGAVTFTDVDLSDTHSVTISGVTESGVTSGLDLDAVQSWLTLGKLTDSTGGATGSDCWTFSAPDKSFDYLAAGETLTLTYMIQVDDHHGGVVTQPVTITITGTNDVPVITSPTQAAAITEAENTTGSSISDTAHGAVTFTDADRSDTHSVSISGVTESGVTTGLDVDAVQSWLTLGKLTDSTGGATGSDCWTFSAPDKSFDYLACGETLTLTYTIQVDDHHGGVVTQPITITITGTNDAPVITSDAQSGAITDIAHTTGSSTPDTASGAVTFTDPNLSDTHSVTVTGVTEQGATSGLAGQSTVLSWLSLGTLADSTGGATGSDAWTFAAADKNFDYLAAGQTVTLTYNVEVNDHHGGVVDQAVTITVTGTDKSPTMSFTTLDATGDSNSQATGINDAGIVVGQADATSTHQVGWFYNGSTFSKIVVPDDGTENGYAQDTSVHAINNFDVIAGDYSPVRSTPRYGFIDNNGDFSKIASDSPYPSTNANGINDAGIVVGSDYLHAGARYTGYADDHGTFIYYNAPGTDNPSGDTFVNGINNHNDVVGSYNPDFSIAADYKGFVYDGETFTTIVDPLGTNGTFAQGINDAGEVVGFYVDANNQKHGFIDDGGVFTTVDDALGVNGTVLNGINNAGAVVGYYVDANNVTHGFVANPTVTISVVTPNGLDFQADNPLKQMGDGAVQSGGGATSYTVVEAASGHEFVVDGTGFTYNADGALTGGIITSFHEFTTDDSPVAIADFTGLSVYAPTWMSAVQQDAAGDKTAIDALTGNYSYVLNGGSGNVNFGSAGHADTLIGTGRDIFDGGGAAAGSHDTLTGGAGSTFVFRADYGALTITNFDQAGGAWDPNEADHIQLNGLSAPLNVSYADGNALLDFGHGDVITLLNVTQTQYEALDGSEFNNGGGAGVNLAAGGSIAAADHEPPVSSTIVANAPNQTMTGTGASNTFVFDFAGIGRDTVTNFNPATDSLLFHTGPLANAQTILNAIQDDGHGNTVINIDASDAIVLSGVVKAQLHASDFHFG